MSDSSRLELEGSLKWAQKIGGIMSQSITEGRYFINNTRYNAYQGFSIR